VLVTTLRLHRLRRGLSDVRHPVPQPHDRSRGGVGLENLNPFLPTLLKKISVIFYLKNLCPVEVPIPPPFNVMVVEADPTPFWIAVPGLLAVALILLVYSAISARQLEISYGNEPPPLIEDHRLAA